MRVENVIPEEHVTHSSPYRSLGDQRFVLFDFKSRPTFSTGTKPGQRGGSQALSCPPTATSSDRPVTVYVVVWPVLKQDLGFGVRPRFGTALSPVLCVLVAAGQPIVAA
ncbi:unnamed protein product [Soboliphyme baturini]|uniref:Uncharacterized protein n=1 Tax=Soboliphyme baturini TaxID=241478 RepID=A0A183IWU5_9BILA|nr:unnamed protein product [Soboliphyme baturini]